MGYQEIILEKDKQLAILTLNRPQALNAFSKKMREELSLAIQEVKQDPQVRVLIITGQGRAFCAGADLRELVGSAPTDPSFMDLATRRVLGMVGLGKPAIAAVNGVAAGGGFALAMMCDIRLAAKSARFVSTFVQRGLLPDGGLTYTLTQALGPGRAAELMLSARSVDSQEAADLGLVNRVVEDEKLMDAARDLARQIAANAPLALARTKDAIYLALQGNLKASLEFEAASQQKLFQTGDFKEGIASFLEKRSPIFEGK